MFCSTCKTRRRRKGQRTCELCHAGYMRKNRKKWKPSPAQRRRMSARWTANVYQKRGKIRKKPCVICGAKKVEKHHEDYRKPLEVDWLCREHHVMVTLGLLSLIPAYTEIPQNIPAAAVEYAAATM